MSTNTGMAVGVVIQGRNEILVSRVAACQERLADVADRLASLKKVIDAVLPESGNTLLLQEKVETYELILREILNKSSGGYFTKTWQGPLISRIQGVLGI